MERKKSAFILGTFVLLSLTFAGAMYRARQEPIEHRPDSMQCGHWSVVRCCHLLGVPVSVNDVFRLLPPKTRGHSLLELQTALREIGFEVSADREELHKVLTGRHPTILHLRDPDHFVVVANSNANSILVFDAVGNRRRIPFANVESRFDGYALHVSRNAKLPLPATVQRKTNGVPCVQFETLYLDHGDVSVGTGPVTYHFPVQNLGSQPLQILQIAADCGCLEANGPDVIEPFAESVITATFRHDPDAARAAFEHEIMVTTNDPLHQHVSLVAAGNTNTTLRPWPSQLDFGQRLAGKTHLQRCFVHYNGEDESVLRDATFECAAPNVRLNVMTREEFLERSPPMEGLKQQRLFRADVRIVEVLWTPTEQAEGSSFTGTLVISAPKSGLPIMQVPLFGTVGE